MKLAVVTNTISAAAGGLYYSVRLLATALANLSGIKVEVLAIEDGEFPEFNAEWAVIKPTLFPSLGPRSINYAPALGAYLRKIDSDIYHVHGLWQYIGFATANSALKTHRPFVISPRGMLDDWALEHSKWKKRLAGMLYEKRNLRNAACIHALCKQEYQSVRKYGLSNPVCILPNGVEMPTLDAEINTVKQVKTTTGKRKLLLFLSRIHPKKGLANLIRAWAEITEGGRREIGWVLGIVGWDQGGHEQELKVLATGLGIPWTDAHGYFENSQDRYLDGKYTGGSCLDSCLIFMGPAFGRRKEILFRASDAFILPSYSEGMPVAVLEAWAYGKPVIMTAASNIPEGFRAGAAIQIETNPESISQGIRQIINMTEAEAKSMGMAGRQMVEERFTWPMIAQQMKSVYDWLVEGGSPPSCVVLD